MSRTAALVILCVGGLLGLAFSSVKNSGYYKFAKLQATSTSSVADELKHTVKLRGSLRLRLQQVDGDFSLGQPTTMQAIISSDKNLSNIKVSWSLPSDLELVSGEQKTLIKELKVGEQKTVVVVLKSNAAENLQLHVHAGTTNSGMLFSETAQFNTMTQAEIESNKVELLKRVESDIQSQTTRLKVYK